MQRKLPSDSASYGKRWVLGPSGVWRGLPPMMFAAMVDDKKMEHNTKAQRGAVAGSAFSYINIETVRSILLNNDDMVLWTPSIYHAMF